jgi:quinoprotein glucose dehydrogenase
MATDRLFTDRHRKNWAVVTLAIICLIFGLVILAGGLWLVFLGGSAYYALAGLGLVATGILLYQHRIEAVWVYLLTWIGTVIWAFWEVGTDWWAQVPRLVAPTLVLILVLLCIPALTRPTPTPRTRRAR